MADDESTTKGPRQRFHDIANTAPAAGSEEPTQLGLWPDDMRGAPNALLRSALFTAGKPTRVRKSYRDLELAAQLSSGITSVIYTGPQLFQPELDVWLEVIHRCRLRAAGTKTDFHVHGFLKSLRRSTGNTDHKLLHSQLRLLKATAVDVRRSKTGASRMRSLVQAADYDEALGRWYAVIDEEIAELFAPKEHTWLHIDARLDLGKSYLAKWCHGYFSSHRKPYPVSVARLRELSGSGTSRLRRFREALTDALGEVAVVETRHRRRFDWSLDHDDLVHVMRQSDN